MKKRLIPILGCLIVALCLALGGCGGDSFGKIRVKGEQNTSYTVYSNGGSAVQYGNYVYFINGYAGYDDTDGKQNVWPNVVKGGLYRAELTGTANGGDFIPAKNTAALTDGMEFVRSAGTDYDGNAIDVVDVQLIAPKRIGTSGYKDGGIFIYDEWVYFASPNNEKNKAGTVQTAKTDFFRARLDGSKAERVYTTAADSSSSPYAFYKYNGAVYLVVLDGTDLVSVRMAKKAEDKVTIAPNVTSVLLPYSKTYYKGMNENTLNHFVYILRAVGDGDSQKTGNVIEIMRPDGLKGGVYHSQGKTDDTLEAVRDGLLFYRTTDNAGNTLIKYDNLHGFLTGNGETYGDAAYKAYQEKLAAYVDETGSFKEGITDAQKAEYAQNARTQLDGTILSTQSISDYTATYCFRPGGESSNMVYMLGVKSSGAELRSSLTDTVTVYDAGMTLLNVAGEYMYFTDSEAEASVIYRTKWNVPVTEKNETNKKEQVSHNDVTSTNFNADYCAGYIVYTGKVDDWADAYTFFKQVDRAEGAEPVFVGVRDKDDVKPEEEESEEEESEEEDA